MGTAQIHHIFFVWDLLTMEALYERETSDKLAAYLENNTNKSYLQKTNLISLTQYYHVFSSLRVGQIKK